VTDLDGTIQALSDPARRQVVELLAGGARRTGELAAAVRMSVPAVSRHLRVLRGSGLVERGDVADDGRGRLYRLRAEALGGLGSWLEATRWSQRLGEAASSPLASDLLRRVGGFLDAFAAGDVAFFERHLHDDVLLVFPGLRRPLGKRECVDSVRSHPAWTHWELHGEPAVRRLGEGASILTFAASIRGEGDQAARRVLMSVLFTEQDGDWRVLHLQQTQAPAGGREEAGP